MQPEIDLFGIPIKTFGLMLALGFLASGLVAQRNFKERGEPADWAYEIIFAALVGGIVGARLWYLAEHLDELTDDPIGALISGSGLTWYGGALGGAACVLGWARWRGMPLLAAADLAAVPLAIGYAVGRIGCQLAGDGDYGEPWNGPWAMAYPDGTVPTDVPVHPTPVYETLAMGLVAYGLWQLRGRLQPGAVFGTYLVLAGLERFLVEFVRRNEAVVAGLSTAQVFSLVLVAGGIATLAVLRSRTGGLARVATS